MDLSSWLVFAHVLGTVVGVGGATLVEVLLIKALRDGVFDVSERSLMQSVYTTIRVGFVIVLVSGVALMLLLKVDGHVGRLWDDILWVKIVLFAIIGINALLLQAHSISVKIGSAVSFVSWYAALFLGSFARDISAGFWTIMFAFVFFVIIGMFILDAIRKMAGVRL